MVENDIEKYMYAKQGVRCFHKSLEILLGAKSQFHLQKVLYGITVICLKNWQTFENRSKPYSSDTEAVQIA